MIWSQPTVLTTSPWSSLVHSSLDWLVFSLSLWYAKFIPCRVFALKVSSAWKVLPYLGKVVSSSFHYRLCDLEEKCPWLCYFAYLYSSNGKYLVNLSMCWFIICFLLWNVSLERAGIRAWLVVCQWSDPEGWASIWYDQTFTEEMKQSWLCQSPPVWPWAIYSILRSIRLQNLLVMKMNNVYVKCLAKCQVHRSCLIIRLFFPKELKPICVSLCMCLWV